MYQAGSFPKGPAIGNINKRTPGDYGAIGSTSNPILKAPQMPVQPRQGPPPSLADKNKNHLLKEVDDELRKLKSQFEMIKNDPGLPKHISTQGFDSVSSATNINKGYQGTVSATTGQKTVNTQPLSYNTPIGSYQTNVETKPMGIQAYGSGRPTMPIKKEQHSAPTLPEPYKNGLVNPENSSKISSGFNPSSVKESPQKNPQSLNSSQQQPIYPQNSSRPNISEGDRPKFAEKESPATNTNMKFGSPPAAIKTAGTTSPISAMVNQTKINKDEVRPAATSLHAQTNFTTNLQQPTTQNSTQQYKPNPPSNYQPPSDTYQTTRVNNQIQTTAETSKTAAQNRPAKPETVDNTRRPPPAKPAKTQTPPEKLKDSPPTTQNPQPLAPPVSQYHTYQSFLSERIRLQPTTQPESYRPSEPLEPRQFSPSQHQRNLSIRKNEAKKIAQQQEKISALSKTSETLVRQNNQLKYQVTKLTEDNKHLNRLKTENQTLQHAAREAQQKYLKLQHQYEQINITVTKKEAIISDLEVEARRMKATLESNTNEGGFNMALKSQLEENQRIKERFREKDDEIEHLRSINQNLRSELDTLRNDIEIEKLKRMAELKNQQTTFDIELQTLLSENTSFKKTVAALDEKFKFMLKADRKKDQFMANFLKGKATDPNDKEIIQDFFKQFEQVPKLTISQLLKQQYLLQDELRKQIQHLKKLRY